MKSTSENCQLNVLFEKTGEALQSFTLSVPSNIKVFKGHPEIRNLLPTFFESINKLVDNPISTINKSKHVEPGSEEEKKLDYDFIEEITALRLVDAIFNPSNKNSLPSIIMKLFGTISPGNLMIQFYSNEQTLKAVLVDAITKLFDYQNLKNLQKHKLDLFINAATEDQEFTVPANTNIDEMFIEALTNPIKDSLIQDIKSITSPEKFVELIHQFTGKHSLRSSKTPVPPAPTGNVGGDTTKKTQSQPSNIGTADTQRVSNKTQRIGSQPPESGFRRTLKNFFGL